MNDHACPNDGDVIEVPPTAAFPAQPVRVAARRHRDAVRQSAA